MDERIVNCFMKAAVGVLDAELGGGVTLGTLTAQGTQYLTTGVTVLLGVTGSHRGLVIFGLTEDTTLSIVSHMMGQKWEELDDLARSGISELGNVVVGNSLTALGEMGFKCGLTPPAVVTGTNAVLSTPNIPRLVVPLLTPAGTVEMQLALRANGVH